LILFSTPKSIGQELGLVTSVFDNHFVLKTNKNITAQDGLCSISNEELVGCLVNKAEKTKEGFKIYPNKKVNFKKGDKIFRNLDVEFNKILENSKTARKMPVEIVVKDDEIVIFDINKNKEVMSLQDFEIAQNQQKMKENYQKSFSKTQESPFLLQNLKFETQNLKFIPISKLNEIRRGLFDKLVLKILSRYKVKTQKQLDVAQFPQDVGDYRLNIHNEKAKEFCELCSCEVIENSFESLKEYKNKELMRTKHCLKRVFLGCDKKIEDKSLFLLDEKNVKYPLSFDCKNCEMIINSP